MTYLNPAMSFVAQEDDWSSFPTLQIMICLLGTLEYLHIDKKSNDAWATNLLTIGQPEKIKSNVLLRQSHIIKHRCSQSISQVLLMINQKEKYNLVLMLRSSFDKVPAEHSFTKANREKGRTLSMDSPQLCSLTSNSTIIFLQTCSASKEMRDGRLK